MAATVSLNVVAESVVQTELVAAILAFCIVEDHVAENFARPVLELDGRSDLDVCDILLSSVRDGS